MVSFGKQTHRALLIAFCASVFLAPVSTTAAANCTALKTTVVQDIGAVQTRLIVLDGRISREISTLNRSTFTSEQAFYSAIEAAEQRLYAAAQPASNAITKATTSFATATNGACFTKAEYSRYKNQIAAFVATWNNKRSKNLPVGTTIRSSGGSKLVADVLEGSNYMLLPLTFSPSPYKAPAATPTTAAKPAPTATPGTSGNEPASAPAATPTKAEQSAKNLGLTKQANGTYSKSGDNGTYVIQDDGTVYYSGVKNSDGTYSKNPQVLKAGTSSWKKVAASEYDAAAKTALAPSPAAAPGEQPVPATTATLPAGEKIGNLKQLDPVITEADNPLKGKKFGAASLVAFFTKSIPSALMFFLGIVVMVVFLLSALRYLLSAGGDDKKGAIQGMTYAALGAFVVVLGYAIISLIQRFVL